MVRRTTSEPGQSGQAVLLLLGALGFVLVGALVLGAIAAGVGVQGRDQRAADLAALAGARALRAHYYGLFEPATIAGRPNPRHVEKAEYLAHGRAVALTTAHRNGARAVAVSFPDGREMAPVRIGVTVSDPAVVRLGRREQSVPVRAVAEAELAPPGGALAGFAS